MDISMMRMDRTVVDDKESLTPLITTLKHESLLAAQWSAE